ncbi:MAG TPA: hypothetical protein VE404_01940 [Verrucomicrobiae bacterium]|nr:hypothetical protein [Verrucomicrobiae bacterium]
MREPQKVVVHFMNHTLLKGHARFFFHHQMQMLMQTLEGEERLIPLAEVKAVFFVRSFTGDRLRKERKEPGPDSPRLGEGVHVTFLDGETLIGRAVGYKPEDRGFYFKPADPASNNEIVYIPQTALREIVVGDLEG